MKPRFSVALTTTLTFSLAAFSSAAFLTVFSGCASSTIGASPDAALGDVPSSGPVGRTIKANSEKFLACARDSVTVQTGTTQVLELRFFVTREGKVQNPRIARMSAPDPDLYGCVLKQLRRIDFPPPSDLKAKEIQYPLTLKPS